MSESPNNENTPLLYSNPYSSQSKTISIEKYWNSIQTIQRISPDSIHELLDPEPLSSTARFALTFLLLLLLKQQSARTTSPQESTVRKRCSILQQQKSLEEAIDSTLHTILQELCSSDFEESSEDDVCLLLQMSFAVPLTLSRTMCSRVIDHVHLSTILLRSELITQGLSAVWEGKTCPESNMLIRARRRLSSPRVHYTLALLLFCVYLGILVHFTLYPFCQLTQGSHLFAVIFIILYSVGVLFQMSPAFTLPFFLTFIIYATRLISSTLANFDLYIVLLALSVHAIHLQLATIPGIPSPLLLLSPHQGLLLASTLVRTIRSALLPVILFFIPLTVLSTISLSLALEDSSAIPNPFIDLTSTSPYVSRLFYIFVITLLSLMGVLLFSVIAYGGYRIEIVFPGSETGLTGDAAVDDAMRNWALIVAHWSRQRTNIPSPFNLVYLFYLRLKKLKLRRFK